MFPPRQFTEAGGRVLQERVGGLRPSLYIILPGWKPKLCLTKKSMKKIIAGEVFGTRLSSSNYIKDKRWKVYVIMMKFVLHDTKKYLKLIPNNTIVSVKNRIVCLLHNTIN